MLGRVLTVIIACLWSALAAGFVIVLFATTPAEILSAPSDVAKDKIARLVELSIFSGVQAIVFGWPFLLLAIVIGEWRAIRTWLFYAIVGVAIAFAGFMAHYASEGPGDYTIVNNYALTAYLTGGFVAGVLYWALAGRIAGGRKLGAASNQASSGSRAAGA